MLLNVNGGIIWARFAWLLAQLLLNPFGQVRVDVLSKMVFPVEAFATLTASVNLVSAMYNRVPLQVFLEKLIKIMKNVQPRSYKGIVQIGLLELY